MKKFSFSKIPLEYYFLVIGLYFGLQLVFTNPPWHTNDEDRHFYNAWRFAHGQFKPTVENKKSGYMIPPKLYNQARSSQGIRFDEKTKINKNTFDVQKRVKYNARDAEYHKIPLINKLPVGFIPHIIGIKIGEVFKKNPLTVHWWARSFGLFTFLLIVFFAIKTIPVFKNVMMLVALAPMSLYQASSVTYDMLCNATTFLIIAYVVKWIYQENSISRKDLLLFFGAFLILIFSKSGYYVVPFLALMVPSQKFGFSYPKIKLILILVFITFIPDLTWQQYIKSLHLPGSGAFQNDFAFGLKKSIMYHLQDIPTLISNLALNVLSQGKDWIIGCIGRFGYSYIPLPNVWIFAYVIILFVIAAIDHNVDFKLTLSQRGISALIMLASVGALLAAFYFSFTPIGAKAIFGAQGRYFIPILPLILLQVIGTVSISGKKYLSLATVLISIVFLYQTISFLDETFYHAN